MTASHQPAPKKQSPVLSLPVDQRLQKGLELLEVGLSQAEYAALATGAGWGRGMEADLTRSAGGFVFFMQHFLGVYLFSEFLLQIVPPSIRILPALHIFPQSNLI